MALTVGLLYNLGKGEPPEEGEPPDAHAELDGEHTVAAVAEALRWAGHDVVPMEASSNVWEKLQTQPLDIAFNMTEGVRGGSRESQVPAVLEMLGIPYTGSGVLTLAVSLDKPTSKKLFAYHGVPTPRFRVVPPGKRADLRGLRFPLFVKPAHEGSSMGITPESVCRDRRALDEQVAYVHRYYRQEALVEEFLEGREFTVGIVGNEDPLVLPIMEINFNLCPPEHGAVYSYHFKTEWDADGYYLCPAPVGEDLAALLRKTAQDAFRALGCLDVGRVDIRLGRDDLPQVLEVNPLPGLTPAFSDLPRVALAAGIPYERLVNLILDAALERYGLVPARSLPAIA